MHLYTRKKGKRYTYNKKKSKAKAMVYLPLFVQNTQKKVHV